MSDVTEHMDDGVYIETVPHYDGDKGWVATDYSAPNERRRTKHNPSGGWVFADGHHRVDYQPGNSGFVTETELDENEAKHLEAQRHQQHNNNGKRKYHAGRRGWVAPDWSPAFDKNYPFDHNPNLPVPSSSNKYLSSFVPRASVNDTDTTIIIEIELPGVSTDNISLELISQTSHKIHFDNNANQEGAIVPRGTQVEPPTCFLLVRGFKRCRWTNQKVFDEREYGYFEKCVSVGNRINKDSPLMAKLEDGILVVFVAKPKAITSPKKRTSSEANQI